MRRTVILLIAGCLLVLGCSDTTDDTTKRAERRSGADPCRNEGHRPTMNA